MTADAASNDAMNVDGTRHALALAEQVGAGCFHQVSSVAAARDFHGVLDETMFAEGQHLPSPYHRTKSESESLVRDQTTVHMAYHVFPDSTAAKGSAREGGGTRESEQVMLARMFKGIHW